MVDPFSAESLRLGEERAHPWTEVLNGVLRSRLARAFWRDKERSGE